MVNLRISFLLLYQPTTNHKINIIFNEKRTIGAFYIWPCYSFNHSLKFIHCTGFVYILCVYVNVCVCKCMYICEEQKTTWWNLVSLSPMYVGPATLTQVVWLGSKCLFALRLFISSQTPFKRINCLLNSNINKYHELKNETLMIFKR